MTIVRFSRMLVLLAGCMLLASCAALSARDGDADATGDLGEVQKESPADLYVKLAFEYLKSGQTETALRKVKTGLALDNGNARAHYVIALIYVSLAQHDLAEQHFRKALSLRPKDPYVLNAWGGFLCDRGKYAEADKQFEQALANPLYRTPSVALTNSGDCARKSGNRTKAEQYFRRALTANPRFGPALSRMADLSSQRGDFKSARTYLDRYFKSAAPTPKVLLLAVRVERKLGSRKRSATYAKMLRKSFPDSPEVLEL